MAQIGLDPEQMGALQKSLQRDAGTLRSLAKQLDSQLRAAWWRGTDADRFRADWDGSTRPQLEQASGVLEAMAKAVATNIAQQTQASQA